MTDMAKTNVGKQKVRKSLQQNVPSVKLTRDDLEKIVGLLTKHCRSVELSDSEFIYDSLEEMEKNRGKILSELNISGSGPDMYLRLSESKGAYLLAPASTEDGELVFLKVIELLVRRRRLLSFLFEPWLWISVFLMYFMVFFIMPVFFDTVVLRIDPRVGLFLVFVLTGIIYFSQWVSAGGLSSIRLAKRHEHESFWSRNRDNLLTGIIAAAAGAIGGSLLTWYLSVK